MIISKDKNSEHSNLEKNLMINASVIRLLSIRRIYLRKAWSEPVYRNQSVVIYFVQTGDASIGIDGKMHKVPENAFALVRPGHRVSFTVQPNERCFVYALTAEVTGIPAFEGMSVPFLIGRNAHIDDLFYHLYRSGFLKMRLETTSDAILALILEQCLSIQNTSSTGEKLYRRFCGYVEENIGGDLSANRISEALSYNKDYISRIVKQFSGKTLKEYISVEKLYQAKHMLSGKEMGYSEIAAALGFSSSELFGKFFKYYTNMTPNEYRREFSRVSENSGENIAARGVSLEEHAAPQQETDSSLR